MTREGTPGLEGIAMPLADVVALCVSAIFFLAGAYSTWSPAQFARIPHWVAVLVLGSAAVVAGGLMLRDRRPPSRTSRIQIRIRYASWSIALLADFSVLTLRALSMVNKETIVVTVLIIALMQLLSAAGLWIHWLLAKYQHLAA